MRILSIETSCDETAISLVDCSGDIKSPYFSILGNALSSQINIHKEYGGVYPMLAKREHNKNLPILLKQVLDDSREYTPAKTNYSLELLTNIKNILSREEGVFEAFTSLFQNIQKPQIDYIVVTEGPGLAPALWTGISFAKALGALWSIPVIPVNHMKGHITSVLMNNTSQLEFPALSLLISGGHTEIVEIEKWGSYNLLGRTVDDAVGEAFDKVARMLDLPYPGGPEISRLANFARENNIALETKLPRPMIHSNDLNFSFSGLKTAVLYYLRDMNSPLSDDKKSAIAREFEDAVCEVLANKTKIALMESGAKTLIVAGGVIANESIRSILCDLGKELQIDVRMPEKNMATDNSLMIACAGYIEILTNPEVLERKSIEAKGNLEF